MKYVPNPTSHKLISLEVIHIIGIKILTVNVVFSKITMNVYIFIMSNFLSQYLEIYFYS